MSELLKQALRNVAQALPDKHHSKNDVLREVLALVPANEGGDVLRKFVALSPQCWATERRAGYWVILKSHFTTPEIVELYLNQFPKELTKRQYEALHSSLMRNLHLSELDARRELLRFNIRTGYADRCQHSGHCYASFVS